MRILSVISRLILGIVFIFSGFVKAVDPLGATYKFSDYFTAFRLQFLDFSALPLAIFLAAFEMLLGITLILGYRRRTVYRAVMWFLSFFTLLTLVLAIFNPVSDCGCFGDALILTNWQTFLKNVVLMMFVFVLYLHRDQDTGTSYGLREWIIIGVLFCMASGFSVWNYRHLPLLDFRPYGVGTVIREKMEIPEGAPVDEYKTTLTYRNRETGKSASFTIDNYPKDTIHWTFEKSESRLISRGFEPPIHDFAIMDSDGADLVDRILADKGYTLLMLCPDLNKADGESLRLAGEWSKLELLAGNFVYYAVTATSSAEVLSITSGLNLDYPFKAADETMLKTMIRSNPGFMLLKNGIILEKWGFRDFPAIGQIYPAWSDMITTASEPLDEKAEMLMEAGGYNAFSYDILDFEQFMPGLVYQRDAHTKKLYVILLFMLGVVTLLLISGKIAPVTL